MGSIPVAATNKAPQHTAKGLFAFSGDGCGDKQDIFGSGERSVGMKTYIISHYGRQGVVEFQSETPAERNILLKTERREPLNDSEQMTLAHWIESALASQGKRGYHLMGIQGSGHRFNFEVAKEGPGLGSW